jgi:hypothetical protein
LAPPEGWSVDPTEVGFGLESGDASASMKVLFQGTPEQFMTSPVITLNIDTYTDQGTVSAYADLFSIPVDMKDYFLTHRRKARVCRHARPPSVPVPLEQTGIPQQFIKKGLLHWNGTGALPLRTRFVCAWTDRDLRIYTECMVRHRPLSLCTERDGKIVQDDSLELYIHAGTSLYRFAANAKGVLMDERDGNIDYTSNALFNSHEEKGTWTGVWILPWEDLGITCPGPGTEIKFNLIRREPRSEHIISIFNPAFGRFENANHSGILVIDRSQTP